MMPDAVMAARQNDANTAGALEAAQDAVSALVVLTGYGILRTSPAGKSTDEVLKDQEVAEVDDAKLTKENKDRVDNLGDTGIQPGDETYVSPVATVPSSTPPGADPGTPTGTDPGADPDVTSTVS
jgi:hypothetical protein